MDDFPIWAALLGAFASILTSLLMIGGYAMGQATWKGKTDTRLDKLEGREVHAEKSRRDIHSDIKQVRSDFSKQIGEARADYSKQISEVRESCQLTLSAVRSRLDEAVGVLKAHGFLNGGKRPQGS